MAKKTADSSTDLVVEAKKLGATSAKLISARDIVLDERVRLKCIAPRCENYDRHLLCPPNLMSIGEFRKIIELYHRAILLQLESSVDSLDKSKSGLSGDLTKTLARKAPHLVWERKLHQIINGVERSAFKRGFYLAAGLIGSDCSLCDECVGLGQRPCRHPFEARPSMQALGIDVLKTCKNAGLTIAFSSKENVKWTGLVLID